MVNFVTVGERIAEIRRTQGLTQIQLAEITNINPSTLAAYERNRRTPKNDAIETIAKALGVSTKELSENDAPKREDIIKRTLQNGNLTTLTLTREEARLILFTRMNPDCMTFLQKYITSEKREREQIEKAWKLIHEFQT